MNNVKFPIPIIKISELEIKNGFLVSSNDSCLKKVYNADKYKCKDFYRKISTMTPGSHICPYGFSVYYIGNYEAFTGLRIVGYFDSRATNTLNASNVDKIESPILNEPTVVSFAQMYIENQKNDIKVTELNELIDQSIHEIGKYNEHINSKSMKLAYKFNSANKKKKSEEHDLAWSIHAYSHMINRIKDELLIFGSEDIIIPTRTINPYSHFETIKYAYQSILIGKSITQRNITSERIPEICCNSSFLTVAFILIDNAYKYSPDGGEISILFKYKDDITINVCNEGPKLLESEEKSIFDFKVRGVNASRCGDGSGIGLYTAKKICDMYNIKLYLDKEHKHVNKTNVFSITIRIPSNLIIK